MDYMVKQDKRYLNLKEKYMDGGELYRKYWEMGDARNIARLVKYVQSKTGTKPTHMGVWKSMWRWASLKENRDIAWEIYQKWNDDVTFEKWTVMMVERIRKAWQHPTDAKYNKFIKDNGWSS